MTQSLRHSESNTPPPSSFDKTEARLAPGSVQWSSFRWSLNSLSAKPRFAKPKAKPTVIEQKYLWQSHKLRRKIKIKNKAKLIVANPKNQDQSQIPSYWSQRQKDKLDQWRPTPCRKPIPENNGCLLTSKVTIQNEQKRRQEIESFSHCIKMKWGIAHIAQTTWRKQIWYDFYYLCLSTKAQPVHLNGPWFFWNLKI